MYLLCNFVINSIIGGVYLRPFDLKYFNDFFRFLEFGLKLLG
jgi:hypothetical protein